MGVPAVSPVERERGADAADPADYSLRSYREIARRAWIKNSEHNLSLLAAGVAFYAFLSFVPLLAAVIMAYGLIADASAVSRHMTMILDLVPVDAARLINQQLTDLTQAAAGKKGLALVVAMAVSLYGASRASGAMISSLNIVYEEEDRRSYIRWSLLAAALAGGAILLGVSGLFAASMLGTAETWIRAMGPLAASALRVFSWAIAAAICVLMFAIIYRFAPNRADARWQWLSLGSVLATLMWLAATGGFGLYAARFGDYDATYGSLGAVVVLLMWLYLSAYSVLLGGLINAEMERQTARDTTTGTPRPMGRRGAVVADTSAALD
ncbi:YihY/virulence factor BrkB family protein [Sphingopyxis sp. PAMC25046]|nr:YihY/virulence factor BrkB family protein [Sphingopyxis sp. PAMC25046]